MGFFATFDAWLTTILNGYIDTTVQEVARTLEPAIVTLAVVYVMIWGYLQLTGKIEEPFVTGLKRIITLAVILGTALQLWLYHEVIVDTFFRAPEQFAKSVIRSPDSVSVVDGIIFRGGDAAQLLVEKGGILDGEFSYYIAGFAIYLTVGLTAIYTIFLLALSRIALSILLALGPFFIALLFFETTKRFFGSWVAQMANYALITILTILAVALLLNLLDTAAQQAVAKGDGIEIADAVRVCMAAGLTFLIMQQVMPMATGLATGISLSSMNGMSRLTRWGMGKMQVTARRESGRFKDGYNAQVFSQTRGVSGMAGYGARRSLQWLVNRPNTVSPR